MLAPETPVTWGFAAEWPNPFLRSVVHGKHCPQCIDSQASHSSSWNSLILIGPSFSRGSDKLSSLYFWWLTMIELNCVSILLLYKELPQT